MNDLPRSASTRASIVFAAALMATASMGMSWGTTTRVGAFASGGVGESEILALDAERVRYSLWDITAGKLSGAYLADVRVRIADAKKGLALDQKPEGPWLLVNQPPGRFEVEATLGDQSLKRATTIHARDHHQLVVYFDVAADAWPKTPETPKE